MVSPVRDLFCMCIQDLPTSRWLIYYQVGRRPEEPRTVELRDVFYVVGQRFVEVR